jgi:hypothetical protein
MKRVAIAIAILSFTLMSHRADADEHRGGDVALGALSGAVVFGPIGAVAGAAVGYAAGPSIARSWGFRRSSPAAQRTRAPTQAGQARTPATGTAAVPAPASKTSAPGGLPPKTAAGPKTASAPNAALAAPPVQALE